MDRSAANAMALARLLSSFRDLVAGSREEERALSTILRALDGVCDYIEIHPFEVLTWREDLCVVETWAGRYQCSACPPTESADIEAKAKILDFDSIVADRIRRDDVEGRIAVVRGVEDPDDVVDVVEKLSSLGAMAVIVLDRFGLRRIVVPGMQLPSLRTARSRYVPTVFARGSELKVSEGESIRLVIDARARHAYGKNVICEVAGDERRKVVLAAHYDHWLWGGADNSLGVGIAVEALKLLKGCMRSTLKLALFSAEEGLPPRLTGMYWAVGSRSYVVKYAEELLNSSALVINIDVVYAEPLIASVTGFEALGLVEEIPLDTDFNAFIYDAEPFAELGLPTITINSFNAMLRDGVYHTEIDTVDRVSMRVVSSALKLVTEIAKRCDSIDSETLFRKGLAKAMEGADLRLEARALLMKVLKHGCIRDPWARYAINRALFRTLVPPEFLEKPMRERGYVGWWMSGWLELPTAMVLDDESEISALTLLADKYCIW